MEGLQWSQDPCVPYGHLWLLRVYVNRSEIKATRLQVYPFISFISFR